MLCPRKDNLTVLTAQNCLHEPSRRSRDEVPVPDGLVPTALHTFLTALGCGLKHTRLIITQCIHAQLQSICTLTRTRRMRVAEFWRQVGAVTSNEDAVTHARPHVCLLRMLPATVFFQVQKEHGKASKALIHVSLRKQQEVVTASLEGDGLTRVNSIVAQATDNHGLHLCFGCAARFLPDVCPPTVPPPATTLPRMTPSGSKDLHTGLLDHVVGGCEELSDQAVFIRHALTPPLKRQRHAPKLLYTVPDWNSLPKQITSLTGTPQHAGTGTCAPDRSPVPTSPHIRQLVLEELRIITDTIPHQARLIRTSARAASGTHN